MLKIAEVTTQIKQRAAVFIYLFSPVCGAESSLAANPNSITSGKLFMLHEPRTIDFLKDI